MWNRSDFAAWQPLPCRCVLRGGSPLGVALKVSLHRRLGAPNEGRKGRFGGGWWHEKCPHCHFSRRFRACNSLPIVFPTYGQKREGGTNEWAEGSKGGAGRKEGPDGPDIYFVVELILIYGEILFVPLLNGRLFSIQNSPHPSLSLTLFLSAWERVFVGEQIVWKIRRICLAKEYGRTGSA